MHYLVTGGAGFIGSHCCEVLRAGGHDITVLDNFSTGLKSNIPAGIAITEGDCADHTLMRSLVAECDGVFHLAAIASVDMSRSAWAKTTRTNLIGSVSVFDAIASRDTPIPCVYASSAAIYGDNPSLPVNEQAQPHPLAAYGVDKYASELHAGVGARLHDIPSTGLRLFNVYGPRQHPSSPYSGVISIFASRLLDDRPITIYGDGSQTRDFVYVRDVVKHMMAAMERHHARHIAESLICNVCTGEPTSIVRLAELLITMTQSRRSPHYAAARAGDIAHSYGSPAHATDTLGLSTSVTLETGLRNTLHWLRRA